MSDQAILTINAGSSSIKFSVYARDGEPQELGRGQVEKLGPAARLVVHPEGASALREEIGQADHDIALQQILSHLEPILQGRQVVGVGHRIVHGGAEFAVPHVLTPDVIDQLALLEPLAPLHQPFNLAAVRAAMAAFPDALQIACFDTGFHRGHPWAFDTFALPRRYFDKGVRRYGFHGLSYDYIAGELARRDPVLARGRVIVAHLGNGASMCAIKGGQSQSSTMGFSALEGLAMGTRSGAIDPGVLLYLMEAEGMGAADLTQLLYKESGLKGLSGLTHDMRSLLASPAPEAAQAIEYYVMRIRHELGGLTADIGGLDALVFTGGVGQNAAKIRALVCDGMEWLGLSLDAAANENGVDEIGRGPVRIFALPTDEERVIARAVNGFLAPGG
ncbi:Acetate kinase [Actibacterium lipolyticum]|uniref:Acetate kinase n=2 Tax=Actibacterium lipolyticum TaxID=1524263 RepID=A0A238KQ63_9RHOB|nr:Acetate kinase [Actibacterium lipolyticum]